MKKIKIIGGALLLLPMVAFATNYVIKAPLKIELRIFDAEYSEFSDWIESGEPFDCSQMLPLASTIAYKESFTQSKTCAQKMQSTKSTYEKATQTGDVRLISEEILYQTVSKDFSQQSTGTLKTRMLCEDILSWGESTGNGVYTVDVDGDGALFSPKQAYCDMAGGGWTLYDNFGTKLAKINAATTAYNSSVINSTSQLSSAGYSYYLSTINNSNYSVWQGYMQFFYSSQPYGYIRKNMPNWAKKIRVGTSNQWYGGTNTVSLGSVKKTVNPNQSHTYFDFSGTGLLTVTENGIVWMDSVWVK